MRPVLSNDLAEFIQKVSIKWPGPFQKKNDRTDLFQGCHGQFLGSIKQPGLDIWKKYLLNDQFYLCFQILEAYNDQVL